MARQSIGTDDFDARHNLEARLWRAVLALTIEDAQATMVVSSENIRHVSEARKELIKIAKGIRTPLLEMLDMCDVDLITLRRSIATLYENDWNAHLSRPHFAQILDRDGNYLMPAPPAMVDNAEKFEEWIAAGFPTAHAGRRRSRKIPTASQQMSIHAQL